MFCSIGSLDFDSRSVVFAGCIALRQSDLALLVRLENGATHWFPLKQIRQGSEVRQVGHRGKLMVSRWIAEQKNLVAISLNHEIPVGQDRKK